jgi:integrase
VRSWVAHLQSKGLAPGTAVAAYRLFAKIMKTAEIDRVISRSPCVGIDLPSNAVAGGDDFLVPQEIARLAEEVHQRYSALVYTAAYTGLRWGELVALRPQRLNLVRGKLDVVESIAEVNGYLHLGPTKTGARRTVSLPRFLCDKLATHLAAYPSKEGLVFSSPQGGPLRRNFYRRHFKPAVVRAGLDPADRFHDLRHTCDALLIAQAGHLPSGFGPKQAARRLTLKI